MPALDSSDNRFRRCLESGHFAITAELTPPRGAELDSLTEAAAHLGPAVTAINLTDGPGARVRMAGLAAAIHLRAQGVEPILQMTCRDRNRIALQADLLGAAAFGIRNLLVLGGDGLGDGDEATPVYDFDTRSLLDAVRQLSSGGTTLEGDELTAAPEFFCGVADIPVEPIDDWRPDALLDKCRAGARFVQTQYCFDVDLLGRYVAALERHGLTGRLYLLAGLGPLRSAAGARWMRDKLFGTVIPDGILRRMEAARDPRAEGIEICAELIEQVRDIDGVAGVHLMAPGNHEGIVDSIRLAGLL